MFLDESVSVPPLSTITEPEPLITPMKFVVSERLNCRTALSVTFPVMEPVVPPSPIRSTPALTVVPPV